MSSLTTYLDGLDNLVAGWNMDGASGNEQDVSPTNSDLVITIGAGAREAAAIEGGGTLSIEFDGADTTAISTSSNPSDIWDSGGSLFALFNADTIGEGSNGGIIWWKRTDFLRIADVSGSTCKLRFRKQWYPASGSWETTNRVITFGRSYAVVLTYDSDSTANDPVIHLYDLATGVETTPAMTETASPSFIFQSDSSYKHYIGSTDSGSSTWDGRISVVRLYDDVLTGTEISTAFTYAASTINVTVNSVVAEASSAAQAPLPTILADSQVSASTVGANIAIPSSETARQIAAEAATTATEALSPGTTLITSSAVAEAAAEAPVPAPTLSLNAPVITVTSEAIIPILGSIGPGALERIPGPDPQKVYVNTAKEVWAQFQTSNGDFFTPTTVSFKTRAPSGVTASYVHGQDSEVVQRAIGVFSLSFTPTSSGKWTVAAKGEDNDAVGQVQFEVVESVFD